MANHYIVPSNHKGFVKGYSFIICMANISIDRTPLIIISMAMPGTDSLEVPTIHKAYHSGLHTFKKYGHKYGTNVPPF